MVMLQTFPQPAFQDDRRGARRGLIMAVILLAPIFALGGVGVDAARGYIAQARLSRAIDAAALAGGRVFYDAQRNSHIESFFETIFPRGFLGTDPVDLDIAVNQDEGMLTVSGHTAMKRSFFNFIDNDVVSLEATAKVRRPSRTAEPVLEHTS